MYDDLRGDGFYFRPSDTLHSTVAVPLVPQAVHLSSKYASPAGSPPSLASSRSSVQRFTGPTVVEHSAQSRMAARDSVYSVSSYASTCSPEGPAELAGTLLPATTYSTPRRNSAGMRQETHELQSFSASTSNLPLAPTVAPPVPAKDPRTLPRPISATYQPYRNSAHYGPRPQPAPFKHAHTPARPSPLQLNISTPESRKNSATSVTIMLSPRTAKSLSPPPRTSSLCPNHLKPHLSELAGTIVVEELQYEVVVGSKRDSMIRRKPLRSARTSACASPTSSIAELPDTSANASPTTESETVSPILAELPTEIPITPTRPISRLLPDLPPTLSRLESLRQRLSLVIPGGVAIEASGEKESVAVHTTDAGINRARSMRTFHSNLSDIELTTLSTAGAGAMARRGRRGLWAEERAVSMPEAGGAAAALVNREKDDAAKVSENFELDEAAVGGDDEDDEVVEFGTARVVFAVAGVLGKVRSVESLHESQTEEDAELVGRVLMRKSMIEKKDGNSIRWWHTRGQ